MLILNALVGFLVVSTAVQRARGRGTGWTGWRCCAEVRGSLRSRIRTVLDCYTSQHAVFLLRTLVRNGETTDSIVDKLMRYYSVFEPLENCMRAMSMAQQRLSGSGTLEEYACSTVLTSMMLSITGKHHGSLRRSTSMSLIGS